MFNQLDNGNRHAKGPIKGGVGGAISTKFVVMQVPTAVGSIFEEGDGCMTDVRTRIVMKRYRFGKIRHI